MRTDKPGGTEYAWDTITETFDGSGNLIQRTTVNDAGQAIASTEINFAGGVMTDRTISYADGRIQETLFTGGAVELTRTIATNATQTVAGGAGNNTLSGGLLNDLLIGGLGNDVFDFTGAFGQDRISDFGRGQDRLDLTDFGIDALADFTANANGYTATQVGRNVVIDLGVNGTITLTNFQIGNLDDSDFVVNVAV